MVADTSPSPSGSASNGWIDTLTPTERRLWQALVSEPGRVFSRAELIARIMPDTIVEERTIDVHIFRLRRKLGSGGSNIELVRSKGYRWRKPDDGV